MTNAERVDAAQETGAPPDAAPDRRPSALYLQNISAAYGSTPVLEGITLDVCAGELVALLGRSGCGKTTLLKIVAGLLQATSGDVFFGTEKTTHVAAERRGVGVVFQKPLLFPYLTVGENVGFGLKMRRVPAPETKARVAEVLRSVQLADFERRRTTELSGGQEQRVALARALVTRPSILLLDEPFSALDASLRAEMRRLVHNLQRQSEITTLFVTHDQLEAATLADRIAFLHDGKLMQYARPRDFHLAPHTPEVARFFGWLVIEGTRRATAIETIPGRFIVERRDDQTDGDVLVAIDPARVRLTSPDECADDDARNRFAAPLESVVDLGARIRFTFRLPSSRLLTIEEDAFSRRNCLALRIGEQVSLSVSPDAMIVFG